MRIGDRGLALPRPSFLQLSSKRRPFFPLPETKQRKEHASTHLIKISSPFAIPSSLSTKIPILSSPSLTALSAGVVLSGLRTGGTVNVVVLTEWKKAEGLDLGAGGGFCLDEEGGLDPFLEEKGGGADEEVDFEEEEEERIGGTPL